MRPGHHKSVEGMGGLELAGYLPLMRAPDGRRLDIRASLRDPFGEWWVKRYSQRASVPVIVLADLSASMSFVGDRQKLEVLSDFTASAAYSAYRTGDPYSFIGCDDAVCEWLPLTHSKSAGVELAGRLRSRKLSGGAEGLAEIAQYLPRQRALVFLVSDFHFSFSLLQDVVGALSAHDVVPVVLWDPVEFEKLPRFGLAQLNDSETGKKRTVFMRASLRERMLAEMQKRRQELSDVFLTHHARPLFLTGGFNCDVITEHFFGSVN
ncbi:MAG: DUF58 domain-containing protein [Burkholderiales bacterium]